MTRIICCTQYVTSLFLLFLINMFLVNLLVFSVIFCTCFLLHRKLDTKPHEKWIVLDVTSGKCRGKLSVPSGWKVLVTGNASVPKECK